MNPRSKKQELQRKQARKTELDRFLIYCEDKYAGPDYFQGIQRDLRAGDRIKILGDFGEPFNLITKAKKHMKSARLRREDKFAPYDQVWCVLDVEAPVPHPALQKALKIARESGIKVAASNPCFELWALIHLSKTTKYMTNDQAQDALEQITEVGYTIEDKKIKNIDLLVKNKEHACEHARYLRDQLGKSNPVEHNPSTNVDVLVDILYNSNVLEAYSDDGRPRCLPTGTRPKISS